MYRFLNLFLTLLVATSVLFAGMSASMHGDRCTDLDANAGSEAASCSCNSHPTDNRQSPEPSEQDHDHDNCLICRLIANFHAEIPTSIELEFDSMILFTVAVETTNVSARPIRAFQGRAPPNA